MSDAHLTHERKKSFTARYAGSLKSVAASQRTGAADLQLGMLLTFIAGAMNAGGFLAVGQYTSHMSGVFSGMADNLALGALDLVLVGLSAFLPFVFGAACSAILINWGRRRNLDSRYALPLLLEAALLLAFGLFGWVFSPAPIFVAMIIPWLCFIMGLQNATVTKISGARMRTTHVTGIVTDIGIELGKSCYWNRIPEVPKVMADREKLRLLSLLLGCFFIGGVTGAIGFKMGGFLFSLPLALLLLIVTGPSLAESRTSHAERT